MGSNQEGRMHTSGFHTGFFVGGGKQSSQVTQCANNNALGGSGPGNSMEI